MRILRKRFENNEPYIKLNKIQNLRILNISFWKEIYNMHYALHESDMH
jgi:hypothetical protein